MPYPAPTYTDGDQAAAAASMSVYCYNNGQTYQSDSADPSPQGVQTENRDTDGVLTGSITRADARRGTINMTLDSVDDELHGATKELLPGYVISFRGRYYVLGNISIPITKGEAVTVAAEVLQILNPIVPELLTILGQKYGWTFAEGALPETLDLSAINTRTGATVVFSIESYDTPGAAAPTGFTINSSTGVITAASPAAVGIHDIKVKVTDTITPLGDPADSDIGWGRVVVTITA